MLDHTKVLWENIKHETPTVTRLLCKRMLVEQRRKFYNEKFEMFYIFSS